MNTMETISEDTREKAIDRFWETIAPVWSRLRENVRGIASKNFDISVEQFHIMRHIRKGRASVSELAEERKISRSAISQTVDLLVEKGLITRRPNADDRRYIQLELTESGNNLLNTIFRQNRAWMAQKMAHLNAEELDTISQAMVLLRQTFVEPED